MGKSIFRVEKKGNYVILDRTSLNDSWLSWKAKGIHAYMLSMPDDWKFYVEELCKHAKDGEDALRSGIKELKDAGYIKRFPVRDKQTKKIIAWETVVYEQPQLEKPDVENPDVGKPDMAQPDVENPTLLITDPTNIECTNTTTARDVFSFWEENGFGTISSYLSQQIYGWIDEKTFEEPEAIIVEAIKEAIESNVRTWRFVNNVLVNWSNLKLKTVQDVAAHIKNFKARKVQDKNKSRPRGRGRERCEVDRNANFGDVF